MFTGKAGDNPREAPFRCSAQGWAPGLTHKHKTRLEKLARNKCSSLLWKGLTYGRKKFYNIGHRERLINETLQLTESSQNFFTSSLTLGQNKLERLALTILSRVSFCKLDRSQGTLKGEVSLHCCPPVWLVWNQLYDNWQFLFLFAKQTDPNRSNRRSTVQWYLSL